MIRLISAALRLRQKHVIHGAALDRHGIDVFVRVYANIEEHEPIAMRLGEHSRHGRIELIERGDPDADVAVRLDELYEVRQ